MGLPGKVEKIRVTNFENIFICFQKVTEQRQVSTKEVIEKTRDILKGVRMNKRAALLLQNRKMD